MKIREADDKIIRINNELYRLEDAMLHYQAFMQMGFRNIPENEIQFKRERIKELSSERERLMDLEVSPVKMGLCKDCKYFTEVSRPRCIGFDNKPVFEGKKIVARALPFSFLSISTRSGISFLGIFAPSSSTSSPNISSRIAFSASWRSSKVL